ncbi:hypothetical protein Tco_0086219 [Tanacetum coccineum]
MHGIHVRMSDARENINCNEYGPPVGPVTEEKDTVGKFSQFFLLLLIKKLHLHKDKYILPEDAKSWVLKSIGACWRGYKCRIKKKHFYKFKDTRTRWNNRPKSIPQKEFAQLLTLWNKKEVVYERKIVELKEDNEKKIELMRKEFVNEHANLVEDTLQKILEKLPPEVARMVLT